MKIRKMKEFYEGLDEFIHASIVNNEIEDIAKKMAEEFVKKGFQTGILQEVLDGERTLETLLKDQKIAMGKIWYNIIDRDIKELEVYFGENDIYKYEGRYYTTKKIEMMEFKTFIKISDTEYVGELDYKDLYEYYMGSWLPYNVLTQRYPKIRKIAGTNIKVPDVDEVAVTAIKESVLSEEFEDTQIVLNCRESNASQFTFESLATLNGIEVGNLLINCKLDIIDGMHRALGIVMANGEYYMNNKKHIDKKIGVRFVCRDEKGAMRIVTQSFKRSDTDKDFTKAKVDSNDYNKFVKKLEEKTKYLRGKIGIRYEEVEAFNLVTYHELLVKMTKRYGYKVNDLGEVLDITSNLSEILDEILERVSLSDKEILKNANIFAVYFAFANKHLNEEFISNKKYKELINSIVELNENDVVALKINTQSCDINRLIKYFGLN